MQSSIGKLALRIYKGTQSAGLSEYPLVSVGSVPITFRPAMPSLVNDPEIWILFHHQDYTLYSYRVTQEDTTIIQICLLIPANMRLSVDNNPYGVLTEAFGIFKSQGKKNVLFEELLAKCPLEERINEMYLPIMTGQKPASFCADSRTQIKALLTFSQYPQLADVSWLEIGLNCATTVSLPIKAIKPGTIHSKVPQQEVVSSHSGEVKNNKIDKNWNRGRGLVYACLLTVVVFVLGVIFSHYVKESDQLDFVRISDTTSAKIRLSNKDSVEIVEIVDIAVADSTAVSSEQDVIKKSMSQEVDRKAQAREVILELVNKGDLQGCRSHYGWNKYLTHEERLSIEGILLDFPEYKKLSPAARAKIRRFISSKEFRSFEEIKKARYSIIKIIEIDRRICR